MLQKYNDSLPHSVDVLYFVKLENYLMRAIMGYRNGRRFKLNWKEKTIDIDNIFSLICIYLYVMYLCYVSCH
jgi:hypothetical protein